VIVTQIVFNFSQSHLSEFFQWKVFEDDIRNRTGRWYLSVMNVSLELNDTLIGDRGMIPRDQILRFQEIYHLRTWTSGCYFYHESTKAWISAGMDIRVPRYDATYCRSEHLTAFGSGVFVVANDIDFEYIFAEAGFEDNLTVYIALLVSIIFYLLLTIWARYVYGSFCNKIKA
jgi:polycystin 1L2